MSAGELFHREVPGADVPVHVVAWAESWHARAHEVTVRLVGLQCAELSEEADGYLSRTVARPAGITVEDYPQFRRELLGALDEAARAAGWDGTP